MTVLKTPAVQRKSARDKTRLFTLLCSVLGGIALLTGAGALICSLTGKEALIGLGSGTMLTLCVLSVLAAFPMFILLISGYADGHARRGVGSTMLHIALIAELAVLCLVLGIIGTTMLNSRVKNAQTPKKISIYSSTGIADGVAKYAYPMLADAVELGEKDKNLQNKVFSNKRKTVNTLIEEGINGGAEDRDVIYEAIGLYADRAKEVYPEKAGAIDAAVEANRETIAAALTGEADAAVNSITTGSVKDEMNPKLTEHYAIMYFGLALLIAGIVLALLDIFLIVLWCTRDEVGRAHIGERIEPFDYLLPFLVGVGVFTLYPTIRVFIMSFQERYRITSNGAGTFEQWGFGNYDFVISGNTSEAFLRGLRNTSLYVLFTVPITAAIAIVIAYLLNQKSKLNALFQTAYFLPMVTTATAVGMVWKWMFNGDHGLINLLITNITQFFGAPDKIAWLMTGGTNHTVPMAVLIIYGIWNSLPFTIILLLSGLQNIDENLYTVAKVDGSSGARIFFKITVPLLSPTIGLVLIINSISAFKVYTEVFVLWSGKPENYQMETVTWFIYNNIISPTDGTHSLGYAAAAAMILFAIIFVFTMLQKFIQRKWVYQ
ncbi:MAG: hypothetical protein CW338_02910 [Clostridiales bacterium]|nr:hypothetical protein [Clostridiales bacterium]